jgi:hypothetical protein
MRACFRTWKGAGYKRISREARSGARSVIIGIQGRGPGRQEQLLGMRCFSGAGARELMPAFGISRVY